MQCGNYLIMRLIRVYYMNKVPYELLCIQHLLEAMRTSASVDKLCVRSRIAIYRLSGQQILLYP